MLSKNYYQSITGQRFGMLTIDGFCEQRAGRKIIAEWTCDCGNTGRSVLTSITNRNKSCGCMRHVTKQTHGLSRTRLYQIWGNMKARCFNRKNGRYPDYGGRGISVCEEWLDSKVFFDWALSNGYSSTLTLDRIENDGNYEPGNCRWATYKEQNANKRKNKSTQILNNTPC